MSEPTRRDPVIGVPPAIPEPSGLDSVRTVIEAALQLVPFGVGSAVVTLGEFLPRGLERQTKRFHEYLVRSLAALGETVDLLRRRLDEQLALAALAQGTLSAARSASDEHLRYLANATARAITTDESRSADHAMLLLRISGDLSASHIRLLDMYDDPEGFGTKVGAKFEWTVTDGEYPLMQVPQKLDPELAKDEAFVHALYRDLERLNLLGDDDAMHVVFDGGSAGPVRPSDLSSTLGRELLAFVSDPNAA